MGGFAEIGFGFGDEAVGDGFARDIATGRWGERDEARGVGKEDTSFDQALEDSTKLAVSVGYDVTEFTGKTEDAVIEDVDHLAEE